MKKFLLVFALILMLAATCFAFTACGSGNVDNENISSDNSNDEHTHSYVSGKCECGAEDPSYVPEPEPEPEKNEISFKTLEVNGTNVYGKVSSDTNLFKFFDEIELSGKAKYVVALDALGMQTVATKTVSLNAGDNTFYIIELVDDEPTAVYTVVIHRVEVYEVSFDTLGNGVVKTQYIEEGGFATEPIVNITAKLGYAFLGWDFDFSKPVTNNVVIKVRIEVKEEMKNFEFTSSATACEITGLKDKTVTKLVIPDYVTSIGTSAFSGCTDLSSVTIGNGVTSIGDYAFGACIRLTSITVSDRNTKYKSVDGNLYTKDGKTLIQYATGKTDKSFVISNGVTSIDSSAFRGCTSLKSVTIGNGVTSIGNYAFYNCTGLEEIYFNATAMDDLSSKNYVFSYAGQNGNGIKVVIGKNVTKIPVYLFYPYSSLSSPRIVSVEFEEGSVCESIGRYAFAYCLELTSVTIPDSVESIGDYAFYVCTGLKSVTIGNGVTSIGGDAFYVCKSLTSIIIPDSVTRIGGYAFYDCTNLTIYCEATSEPSAWDSDWNKSDCPVVWGYKG